MYMSVGVMKDYKLKLRKLRASHTNCLWGRGKVILSKFICSRIKKRRKPRVTVVTLKLCGEKKK